MEYEIFEPDPEDEYYDQLCGFAYAMMFNGKVQNADYRQSIDSDVDRLQLYCWNEA